MLALAIIRFFFLDWRVQNSLRRACPLHAFAQAPYGRAVGPPDGIICQGIAGCEIWPSATVNVWQKLASSNRLGSIQIGGEHVTPTARLSSVGSRRRVRTYSRPTCRENTRRAPTRGRYSVRSRPYSSSAYAVLGARFLSALLLIRLALAHWDLWGTKKTEHTSGPPFKN